MNIVVFIGSLTFVHSCIPYLHSQVMTEATPNASRGLIPSEVEPVSFFYFLSMLIRLRLHCSVYHLITILVALIFIMASAMFDYRPRSSFHHQFGCIYKKNNAGFLLYSINRLNLLKVDDARLQLFGHCIS